jgi:DNA polymerase III subunit delta
MVAIKNHEADKFLKRDPAGFQVYLVFGTDLGLINERVRVLTKTLVDDPTDPFQLVRLPGDEVASDPGRLADEANTVPLFGGRRAILLDAGAKSLIPALEVQLDTRQAAPVVIEAGALKRDAPLRKLVERSRTGVAIECYPDDEGALERLIEAEAAAAGLGIEGDAKAMLTGLLGADRLASRAEIAKLTLFAHGRSAITAEDVEAVVADASALASEALIDAAFLGDLSALEQSARRVMGPGGTDPGVLLGAALRHATWLHRARVDLDGGAPLPQVLEASTRAGISFKRKAACEQQLKRGKAEILGRMVIRLGDAIGQVRREPGLGPELALRALWTVAWSVGNRSSGGRAR